MGKQTEMTNSTILGKVVLISTLLFWAILIIGFSYASFFVSTEIKGNEIMSPRTATQLFVVIISWWVAPILEILAIVAFLKGDKTKQIIAAIMFNALPILFLLIIIGVRISKQIIRLIS